MSSTSAVAVSIQAVSPALIGAASGLGRTDPSSAPMVLSSNREASGIAQRLGRDGILLAAAINLYYRLNIGRRIIIIRYFSIKMAILILNRCFLTNNPSVIELAILICPLS
jgi:hypothetical protein